jgi:RNA methyltransferase, TrmH family
MLSKAQSKYIRSLTLQKFRNEYKVFVAEGEKIAGEWLAADLPIKMIVATAGWIEQNRQAISKHAEAELHVAAQHELAAISGLQTPNKVLLVLPVPVPGAVTLDKGWCIALDDIQDPGNMGTIIRIADWFGIKNIVCSPDCADVYNPKVVQSAMGGHMRVNIFEEDLKTFLMRTNVPKYAAALEGESAYESKRGESGILIIGNESKGISAGVMALATQRVTIPRRGGAESLNAAVSAGILCALLLPC